MARSRSWILTVFVIPDVDLRAWAEDVRVDEWYAKRRIKCMSWTLEMGDEGHEHIQLFVAFDHQVRMGTVQKRLALPGAHCEAVRKTPHLAWDYCQKEEGRIAGPWSYGDRPQQGRRSDLDDLRMDIEKEMKPIDLYRLHFGAMARAGGAADTYRQLLAAEKARARYVEPNIVLLKWQRTIVANLKAEQPLRRRIWWVWSRTSKTGKTTFMEWIIRNLDGCVGGWNLRDFLQVYRQSLNRIICFNLPRHQEMDEKKLATLELLSDGGDLLATKYAGGQVPVHAHILVFANVGPPVQLPDRIVEVHLEENALEGEAPRAEGVRALVRADAIIDLTTDEELPDSVEMDMGSESVGTVVYESDAGAR